MSTVCTADKHQCRRSITVRILITTLIISALSMRRIHAAYSDLVHDAGGDYISTLPHTVRYTPLTSANGTSYLIVPGYRKVIKNVRTTGDVQRLASDTRFDYLFVINRNDARTPSSTSTNPSTITREHIDTVIDVNGSIRDPQSSDTTLNEQCPIRDITPIVAAHPLVHTIPLSGMTILGDPTRFACYRSSDLTTLTLLEDDITRQDIDYLTDHQDDIQSHITALTKTLPPHPTKKQRLNAIHAYLVNNSAYDYEVLSLAQGPDTTPTPFLVSSFFAGKDIVCLSYAKTFAYIAALMGIDDVILEPGWMQPLNTGGRIPNLGHIRAVVDGSHYDPTFDTTIRDLVKDIDIDEMRYQGISRTCHLVDHVVPDGPIFHTPAARAQYLGRNLLPLSLSCPSILIQTLQHDRSLLRVGQSLLHDMIRLVPYPPVRTDPTIDLPFHSGISARPPSSPPPGH